MSSLKTQGILARLNAGEKVVNTEGGNSMLPLIKSKQPCTLELCNPELLEKGDIVYVKVRGNVYTHKVIGVRKNEVQIGNNKGGVNGWTNFDNVYAIVTEIDGTEVKGAKAKVRKPEPKL